MLASRLPLRQLGSVLLVTLGDRIIPPDKQGNWDVCVPTPHSSLVEGGFQGFWLALHVGPVCVREQRDADKQ